MKRIILPALLYVAFYGFILLILTVTVHMYQGIIFFSPDLLQQHPTTLFLPETLVYIIPAATAAALTFVLLIRSRTEDWTLIGNLFIIIVAFLLYAGPEYMVFKLHSSTPERTRFPLYEGKLTQQDNFLIYNQKISPSGETGVGKNLLGGASIIQLDKKAPRIDFYPQLFSAPDDGTLNDAQGRPVFDYASRPTLVETIIAPSEELKNFTREVRSLADRLYSSLQNGLIPFLVSAAAHVLFMTGTWAIVRTSRWPLWNGILALIFFRALFSLDAMFHGEAVQEGLKIFNIQRFGQFAPAAGFLFLFLLCMVWGLLFLKPRKSREAKA